MKFLIVIVYIFVAATGQKDVVREHFGKALGECKEVTGATDADVNLFKRRKTPDSDAGKCMIACVNKKLKIADENGKIEPAAAKVAIDVIINGLEKNLYTTLFSIYSKCFDEAVDGPDECYIAAHFYDCFGQGTVDAKVPLVLAD